MNHNTYKNFYRWCCRLDINPCLNRIPDKIYLEIVYFLQCGYWFDIEHPQTYNEKVQWMKLHDRNPSYTRLADKYEVKEIVKEKIGEKYIVPTLAVGERFEEINISELPNQFVMKCTHDSGSIVVCKDKNLMDWNKIGKKLDVLLEKNYFWYLREWQYKNIKPRILVEQYIGNNDGLPYEYKFFCFDGLPKIVMVVKDRENVAKSNFYDLNFMRLPLKIENPNFEDAVNKPQNFEEMLRIAGVLSKGIRHVRVDLYNVDEHIYFSEMTFQHWGGFSHIDPPEWDQIMGEWIKIDELGN